MPECATGTQYCFCPEKKVKQKHPCKSCGRFLHGGPCAFNVEGGFGLPNVLYCVKCFHRENVLDEATRPFRFPPSGPQATPVQQQQQQISNERRQSPNNRKHSSCLSVIHSTMASSLPSSRSSSPAAYSFADDSSPTASTGIDYAAVSSPKKRSAALPLSSMTPSRKRFQQSLLGYFKCVRR